MKIDSSTMQLASQSAQTRFRYREEKVLAWVGERPQTTPPAAGDSVQLSRNALARALPGFDLPSSSPTSAATTATGAADPSADMSLASEPKFMMMKMLLEAMTGRKLKLMTSKDFQADPAATAEGKKSTQDAAQSPQGQQAKAGWGIEAEMTQVDAEVQQVSFSAKGVVKTADGKTITLEASLQMSSERITVTNASLRAGDAQVQDPLILNFGGTAAELTGNVNFDLNSDGKQESVDFVGPHSGVLVFGANGQSRPKDGSSLFGTKSGNGFADLARYDTDKNGWIDEGDSAFTSLGVWTRDTTGTEKVSSLKDMGVGAIYLGNTATNMDIRGDDGALQGRLRSTGVYLTESGSVGTAQQVDLAVREQPTQTTASLSAQLGVLAGGEKLRDLPTQTTSSQSTISTTTSTFHAFSVVG